MPTIRDRFGAVLSVVSTALKAVLAISLIAGGSYLTDRLLRSINLESRGWYAILACAILGLVLGHLIRGHSGMERWEATLQAASISGIIVWYYAWNTLGFEGRVVFSLLFDAGALYLLAEMAWERWNWTDDETERERRHAGPRPYLFLLIAVLAVVLNFRSSYLPNATSAYLLFLAIAGVVSALLAYRAGKLTNA